MKQDTEDNVYFKILLDKVIELTKENENLKLEIEELKKYKERELTKKSLDRIFDKNNFK